MQAQRDDVPVGDSDREAARRALAQNWPGLEPENAKYAVLFEGLSEFHRLVGAKNFELRYNLRPPKDRTEEWTKQLMHEEITDGEYRAHLKADAERPIDLEMLATFCDAYQEQLEHYSGVLQEAVIRPSEVGTSAWRDHETAIDNHVAALQRKLPLWRENLETVFDFLEELRVTSGGGLIKLGDYEGTSAHWLTQLVLSRMVEAWRSCKDVSDRSQKDSRYLYAARPIDLFQQWLTSFPTPQSLGERLREEFVLARAAVRRLTVPATASGVLALQPTVDSDPSIDNESRELILVGDMFSIIGKAGHIFRPTPNSDWGIDGEIEFKDAAGNATGRRVYLQLKSGDSYLACRTTGIEVFTVKNLRHLEYWIQHAYPVMLVIRQSSGLIRWMDVSAYLRLNGQASRQIIFQGTPLTLDSVRDLAGNQWKPS